MKAGSSNLSGEDSVDEGIAKLLSGCQQQILANLCPAETGREPEGVHQLRVALRRLRTALYLLRRELNTPSLQSLDAEAQRFARTLGPARNWDVFIRSTVADLEKANLPDIEFSALREASAPFREKSYHAVRDSIADPQTNRFLLSLGLAIEQREAGATMSPASTLAYWPGHCRSLRHASFTASNARHSSAGGIFVIFAPKRAKAAAHLEEIAVCHSVLPAALFRPGVVQNILSNCRGYRMYWAKPTTSSPREHYCRMSGNVGVVPMSIAPSAR